jgi:hypothetical protein
MRQHTTKSDGRANQGIELFVTADGELQVPWRDTLDLEILRCVASQFKDFGGEVFEDSGDVDSGCKGGSVLASMSREVGGRRTRTRKYLSRRLASCFGCCS